MPTYRAAGIGVAGKRINAVRPGPSAMIPGSGNGVKTSTSDDYYYRNRRGAPNA